MSDAHGSIDDLRRIMSDHRQGAPVTPAEAAILAAEAADKAAAEAADSAAAEPDPACKDVDVHEAQRATGDDGQTTAETPSAGTKKRSGSRPRAAPADSVLIVDFEAEEAIIAACLQSPNALRAIATRVGCGELALADFEQIKMGKLLGVMLRLQAEGVDEFDAVTLANVMEGEGDLLQQVGGIAGIRTLRQQPDVQATLVGRYAKIVREKSAERYAQAALKAALESMGNGKPAAEVLAEVEARMTEARAMVEATEGTVVAEPIDWSTFWDTERVESEWVFEDVLAKGRSHCIWAGFKVGKSLLMLAIAAKLATGEEPNVVLYFDMEMTEADVQDRLEEMGYGKDTDLSRLKYYLLPALPDLDTAEGGLAMMAILDRVERAWPDHHPIVIIDTFERVLKGKENDADTIQDFYRHTGIRLKRRGVTSVRLDHGGKDKTLGPRGTSGKGDDVDVLWELTKTNGGVCLKRTAARMSWVPERVTFTMPKDPPLRYVRRTDDWPEHTGEVANILDDLDVPLDASAKDATERLQAIKEGRHKALVLAALKYRRKLRETNGS